MDVVSFLPASLRFSKKILMAKYVHLIKNLEKVYDTGFLRFLDYVNLYSTGNLSSRKADYIAL